MNDFTIIKASLGDLPALRSIAVATFLDAFADANSPENMQSYIDHNFSLEGMTMELQNPDSSFFLALHGSDIVGYAKVNSGNAQTELKEPQGMELERIYVIRPFWGKGVADLLCSHAIHLARESGKSYLWLGVWEQNHRAIRFYEKHGFKAFSSHNFVLGNDVQTDLMLKLDLS